MLRDDGEQTRMRAVAAGTMLQQHRSVHLRLTERGFELTAEGESEPVVCESWPRAKRVLQQLGVPERSMKEISTQLSGGSEVLVRTKG